MRTSAHELGSAGCLQNSNPISTLVLEGPRFYKRPRKILLQPRAYGCLGLGQSESPLLAGFFHSRVLKILYYHSKEIDAKGSKNG